MALKDAYNNGGYGRTLDAALKSFLKGNFLLACLTLLDGDNTHTPLGSYIEKWQVS